MNLDRGRSEMPPKPTGPSQACQGSSFGRNATKNSRQAKLVALPSAKSRSSGLCVSHSRGRWALAKHSDHSSWYSAGIRVAPARASARQGPGMTRTLRWGFGAQSGVRRHLSVEVIQALEHLAREAADHALLQPPKLPHLSRPPAAFRRQNCESDINGVNVWLVLRARDPCFPD